MVGTIEKEIFSYVTNQFHKRTIYYLDDVGISAIVKNEIMNPAGGIERFTHSHAPFVGEMVVQDTGSTDGTYEKLCELQEIYPNLIVPKPIPFNGFADARNISLSYITTPYTLVIDSDELITHSFPENNWEELSLAIENIVKKDNYPISFYLSMINLFPSDKVCPIPTNSVRFFKTGAIEYSGSLWENPICRNGFRDSLYLGVPLYHFVNSPEQRKIKNEQIYHRIFHQKFQFDFSKTKGFKEWKKFNSKRDLYE